MRLWLVVIGGSPTLAMAGALEDFQTLDQQLTEMHEAYGERLEALGDAGADKLKAIPDDRPEVFKKIEALAIGHLGEPEGAEMAVSAFKWSWVLDYDLDNLPRRFGRIAKYYPQVESLDDVLSEAGYFGPRVGSPKEWLEPIAALLKTTKRNETRLGALMARGQIELGEKKLSVAEATFRAVMSTGSGTDFVDAAKGFIFEIQRLQPGMVAPDFTAKTIDGRSVSLKSLRGKAVLLNFWASW